MHRVFSGQHTQLDGELCRERKSPSIGCSPHRPMLGTRPAARLDRPARSATGLFRTNRSVPDSRRPPSIITTTTPLLQQQQHHRRLNRLGQFLFVRKVAVRTSVLRQSTSFERPTRTSDYIIEPQKACAYRRQSSSSTWRVDRKRRRRQWRLTDSRLGR